MGYAGSARKQLDTTGHVRNSTHTLSSNISRHLHASLSSLYIYNLMQHDIGHVMHDAGSDKCWVALTVGTTCGPGRHKSCQKLTVQGALSTSPTASD